MQVGNFLKFNKVCCTIILETKVPTFALKNYREKHYQFVLRTLGFDNNLDYFKCFAGLWLTQINCKETTAVKAPGGCSQ